MSCKGFVHECFSQINYCSDFPKSLVVPFIYCINNYMLHDSKLSCKIVYDELVLDSRLASFKIQKFKSITTNANTILASLIDAYLNELATLKVFIKTSYQDQRDLYNTEHGAYTGPIMLAHNLTAGLHKITNDFCQSVQQNYLSVVTLRDVIELMDNLIKIDYYTPEEKEHMTKIYKAYSYALNDDHKALDQYLNEILSLNDEVKN
jgi:hypothetical protein